MYATLLLVASFSAIQANGSYEEESGFSVPVSQSANQPGISDSNTSIVADPNGSESLPHGPLVTGRGCWFGCGECVICGNRQRFGRCHCNCPLRSTCDMYQHFPYFPEYFGYYYFRPYNYMHMLEHQNTVLRWGGDPRNPYSHQLFDKLYVDAQVEEATPFDPNWKGRLPRKQRLPNLERLLEKGPLATPEN